MAVTLCLKVWAVYGDTCFSTVSNLMRLKESIYFSFGVLSRLTLVYLIIMNLAPHKKVGDLISSHVYDISLVRFVECGADQRCGT